MPVLIEREHLHGNVARAGVLLEMIQHRPAQHVGQENVERNRRGMILVRQRQRLGARHAPPAP